MTKLRFIFLFYYQKPATFVQNPNILRPKCQRGVIIKGTALRVGLNIYLLCVRVTFFFKDEGWAINNM